MARDIADLLSDAVEERAHALGDLRPTAAAFALTRVRIRRRRIVQHSVEAGIGVAASGAVAAGAWFGAHLDRTPTPPAESPSSSPAPSATSEPSGTAGPSAEPTGAPTAPAATAEPAPDMPGQPAALVPPDDLVERMGDGWVVAVYRSAPPDGDGVSGGTHAAYAVDPDGTRYRITELPNEQTVEVVDWHAGEQRVRVVVGPVGTEGGWAGWLDLRTGALTTDDTNVPGGRAYLARLDDGTELWLGDLESGQVRLYAVSDGSYEVVGDLGEQWMPALLDPSQTAVATLSADSRQLITLDLTTGERRTADVGSPYGCSLLGWPDDESVLVSCFDASLGGTVIDWQPRIDRIDVATGLAATVAQIGLGDPFVATHMSGVTVGGGSVAFPAYTLDASLPVADVCGDSVWQWSPAGGLRQLWAADEGTSATDLAAVGGTVYVESWPGCMAGLGSERLDAVDADGADGATRVVAPAPEPVDGVAWVTSLSWAAAR